MAAPDERGRARPESGADGMCRARPERGGDGGRPPPLPGRVVPRRVVPALSGLFRVPERRVRGGGAGAAAGVTHPRPLLEPALHREGRGDLDRGGRRGPCVHGRGLPALLRGGGWRTCVRRICRRGRRKGTAPSWGIRSTP